MASQPQTGLTYEDLQAFPEDGLRREIIGGDLFVTAAPIPRHQLVVATLVAELVILVLVEMGTRQRHDHGFDRDQCEGNNSSRNEGGQLEAAIVAEGCGEDI